MISRLNTFTNAASHDTTFYRYAYDNQRYLKFTTHHTTGGGGGGGGGCSNHCPVYIPGDEGGGQAFNTQGLKLVRIASLPSDTYLKFTTHTPPPPGGGGGGGCSAHCPVYVPGDEGGGQAYNTQGLKLVRIASAPTDTITSETRYPGSYHEVQAGVAVKDYLFLNNQRVGTLKDRTFLSRVNNPPPS